MKNVYENILMELNPSPLQEYPLHWQVIYQEAMRSRHILFDETDVNRFQGRESLLRSAQWNLPLLKEAIVKLVAASNIKEMQVIIQELSVPQRKNLFRLYLRALNAWRQDLQMGLN